MNYSLPVIPAGKINSCDLCTACCTVMAVEPLGKDSYSPCKHLCEQGCAIYSSKPSVCSVWECAWKSGWIDGDERRRPDQLGVMFEFHIIGGCSFLWAYEVWPDAFDSPKARYLLQRLGKTEILVRIKYGSKTLDAPRPVLALIQDSPSAWTAMPRSKLELASGDIVEVITERVGNGFVVKQVEPR